MFSGKQRKQLFTIISTMVTRMIEISSVHVFILTSCFTELEELTTNETVYNKLKLWLWQLITLKEIILRLCLLERSQIEYLTQDLLLDYLEWASSVDLWFVDINVELNSQICKTIESVS